MNFIERVMRVMTHINIGTALGLAAWVMWTSWQVVTGHIHSVYRVAEFEALMSVAHAGPPVPMQLVPLDASRRPVLLCPEPQPTDRQPAVALSGADL